MKTFDFLARKLGERCELHNQMWKFDVLAIPTLGDMATRDAALADIILISCHGLSELPDAFKGWVEAWLAQKPRAIGLVLLFSSHEDSPEADYVRKYAEEVARRGKMEFFIQPTHWKPEKALPPSFLGFPRAADFAPARLPPLTSILERDVTVPRWGINE